MLFISCVCHAFASIYCCLVVTCWERADIWFLFVMSNCDFVTFPCGILGQVWYLIVLIPDMVFAVFLTFIWANKCCFDGFGIPGFYAAIFNVYSRNVNTGYYGFL